MGDGSIAAAVMSRAVAERFCAAGLVTADDLTALERQAEQAGLLLHAALAHSGLVPETEMAQAMSTVLDLPLARAAEFPHEPILLDRLPGRFLAQVQVLPLSLSDGMLRLAMADPLDSYALRAVQLATGLRIARVVARTSDIADAVERLHGGGKSAIAEISAAFEGQADEDAAGRLRVLADDAPVIRLVDLIIARAVESRASDIHIEAQERRMRVRIRIDGMLQETEAPPLRLAAAIVSRIKLMARMDIAERRLPQDGRIKLPIRGREIDLRVATAPTLHGESVTLRILDRSQAILDLDELGFDDAPLRVIETLLQRPHGIFLVTGPTGSGKTTTLYAGLKRLNGAERKILTVEDPIEYQLAGVNQIQVNPQIGLSFPNVLRSLLRHDPDIMMVGEIRDRETAEIATQAALTGHLVLSTLHTNSAAAAFTRLLDTGVEPYLIASTVVGVVAQRLVRLLCPACKRPVDALRGALDFGLDAAVVYEAAGCESCNGIGYRGRTVIFEILVPDGKMRALVLQRADTEALAAAAASAGMRSLSAHGLMKVARGLTSLPEVLRHTRNDA